MIHAAFGAFPSTVSRMTICSVCPSKRTAEVSCFTLNCRPLCGTIAPQPQAYAGATSEPNCTATSNSATNSARRRSL
ncbi:hypothetical protein Sviol_22000 [Streptomyces violascens]|uniref:Uncharacterized protein n=1 Tax=Streptomyces violascens TaxID=67381 RepID=A0ABQ3QKH9_9ACTN|nr:hypothetical protein Sviol_22000 [Streptomyces violascens]